MFVLRFRSSCGFVFEFNPFIGRVLFRLNVCGLLVPPGLNCGVVLIANTFAFCLSLPTFSVVPAQHGLLKI